MELTIFNKLIVIQIYQFIVVVIVIVSINKDFVCEVFQQNNKNIQIHKCKENKLVTTHKQY